MHQQKPIIYTLIILAFIASILMTGTLFIDGIPFLLMQVFGVLLMGWAFLAQKVNKKHHHYASKDLYLVTKGPYEIIRHPMYAGILFIMAGYVQGYPSIIRFVIFGLLLFFIIVKLVNDENRMQDVEEKYKDYQKRTHKLMPYIY